VPQLLNVTKHLGEVLKELARRRECKILEGHLMPDHANMLISIPPKYAVSQVVGFIKGKSAIHKVREYFGRKKNFLEHAAGGCPLRNFDFFTF